MEKYTSDYKRKIIVAKILKRIKEIKKHDVLMAFGKDSSSYDLKNDLFVYMPNDKKTCMGKYKDLYFEYGDNRLFCFKKSSADKYLILTFVARLNNDIVEGKIEPMYYPFVACKGEYLNSLIPTIDDMSEKQKRKAIEEKKNSPRK